MDSETSNRLPVVIVQLACHPSISVHNRDATAEPFLSDPSILETLQHTKFEIDEIRTICRSAYLTWHRKRVEGVLKWLEVAFPDLFVDHALPPVIIFPEGAIPASFLPWLAPFAQRHKCVLVAGTHSLSAIDHSPYHDSSLSFCNEHGTLIDVAAFLRETQSSPLMTKSLVPVIFPNGHIYLRLKTILSRYEFVEGYGGPPKGQSAWRYGDDNIPTLHISRSGPIEASERRIHDRVLRLCVHVCSEALQLFGPPTAIDLYAIPSCNHSAVPFQSQMWHVSHNQVAVAYCNDGRYGGSKLAVVYEPRGKNIWTDSSDDGHMPVGDSLLIAEVDVDRQAPERDVSNVEHHYVLRCIAPIVAASPGNPEHRIALTLAERLEPAKSPYQAPTTSIIRDLFEGGAPSNIQSVLLRIVLNLLESGSFTNNEYLLFTRHCSYDPAPLPGVSAGAICTLGQLEQALAAATYTRLRYLVDAPNARTSDQLALANALDQCAHHAHLPSAFGLIDIFWHEIRTMRDGTLADTRRELVHRLGAIVEAFRGTSAWLFVADRSPEWTALTSAVSHNTPAEHVSFTRGNEDAHGMVVHVAKTAQGYFSNRVVDEYGQKIEAHYHMSIATTRSEIAVPILEADGAVLGVLNIEANEYDAFNAAMVGVLQTEAAAFAADLMVLRACGDRTNAFVWNPRLMTWALRTFLNRLSFQLATAFDVRRVQPVVSCTYWHVDAPKRELYVRGTTRFDYEYIGSRALSLDNSLLGSIARRQANSGTGVYRSLFVNCVGFARRLKAKRMELQDIVAAPFAVVRSKGQGAVPEHPVSDGVVAFYAYAHDYGHEHLSVRGTLTDYVMTRLAELSGRCIGAFQDIQRAYVELFVTGALMQRALVGYNAGNIILDSALKCLRSPAGTLFVQRTTKDSAPRLVPIATTGLTQDGQTMLDPNDQRCEYAVEEGGGGLTVTLARHPGRTLRKNDVTNRNEPVAISGTTTEKVIPENRVTEAFELSQAEHRRFLGAATREGREAVASGVLRLNRSSTHAPYVGEDERVMGEIVRAAGRVVEAEAARVSGQGGAVDEGKSAAMYRLGRHWPALCGWNIIYLDAVLQDIMSILKQCGGTRAEIRLKQVNHARSERLVFLRQFSLLSRDPLGEECQEPVDRGRAAEAWSALERRRVVIHRATKGEDVFGFRASGCFAHMYLPFGAYYHGERLDGVVGVDMESAGREVWGQPDTRKAIGYAIAKLSLLGVDNSWVTRHVLEYGLSRPKRLSATARYAIGVIAYGDDMGDDARAGPGQIPLRVGTVEVGAVDIQEVEEPDKMVVATMIAQFWYMCCMIRGGQVVGLQIADCESDGDGERLCMTVEPGQRAELIARLVNEISGSDWLEVRHAVS
jgi:hypothetical protein